MAKPPQPSVLCFLIYVNHVTFAEKCARLCSRCMQLVMLNTHHFIESAMFVSCCLSSSSSHALNVCRYKQLVDMAVQKLSHVLALQRQSNLPWQWTRLLSKLKLLLCRRSSSIQLSCLQPSKAPDLKVCIFCTLPNVPVNRA